MNCEHDEIMQPDTCEECRKACIRDILDAGIPLSVIEGKTKLSDHFSQEYIDWMKGKKE